MKTRLGLTIGALLLLAAGCVSARMASPPTSSVVNGRLAPCPGPPNCVCSQEADPAHYVAPLSFEGSTADAMGRLKDLVEQLPRTTLIESRSEYLRFEFRSLIFRFVDDVEFLADPKERLINVRSASRVGYSDLGANRKRVELLRELFSASSGK